MRQASTPVSHTLPPIYKNIKHFILSWIFRRFRYGKNHILWVDINFQRLHQTVSAVYSFFLALTLYPEVARKAQAEIDAVVGNDRLPTFKDRPYLPYINALTMEVFRWNTVVPTGMTRCSHHYSQNIKPL